MTARQDNARTEEAIRQQAAEKAAEHKRAEPKPIPDAVLQGLEEVRADGEHNMLERNSIIRDMLQRADTGGSPLGLQEGEYRKAILWLVDNESRYMEALKAMGARRSKEAPHA